MRYGLLSLLLTLFIPAAVFAQLQFGQTAPALEIKPAFPSPNENVTVNLSAYAFDTNGATIKWFINGVENTAVQNLRSINIKSTKLGETTEVKTKIKLTNGQILEAKRSFIVSDIDLIIDSYTLTPAFYQGRPLPSTGSIIQITALPKVGTPLAPTNYNYTWKFNNDIIGGGSTAGGYIQKFIMPTGRGATLQVSVSDSSGKPVAQKSVFIPNNEPELVFYVDNPLRGLSRIGLSDTYQLLSGEVTLRAEPYFMDAAIFTKKPILEWSLNNKVIKNPSDDPQNITLQNAGGNGRFKVGFHIRNLNQLLQGVEKSFNLVFNE